MFVCFLQKREGRVRFLQNNTGPLSKKFVKRKARLSMVLMTLITWYYYFRMVFVIFIYANTTYRTEKVCSLGRKRSMF